VSEVELQSLRERIEHYQKEVASFKEKACADGRRIREQDKKMEDMKRRFKNMERWFEVDKTLLESQFHSTLLETTDTSFQMGRQSMASLYSKAAQEFDGGKGIFLLDWEVLLRWINVLEQRKANQHARQKEKLCEEVLWAQAGLSAETHPPSPVYVPDDPPEEEGGMDHAKDDAAGEEEDP